VTGRQPDQNAIGDLVAAKIITRVAGIHRFYSSAAFASYCGVAPLEASSGDVKRHRLSRHSDRQLNSGIPKQASDLRRSRGSCMNEAAD